MSPPPLAPSESVDAFLSWLAQPTVPVVPGHGHAHHTHGHGHGQNHNHTHGLGYVPQKGKVSSSEQQQQHQQQQEYAARLRELARSPLEDMAKPLLVGGPIAPSQSQSEGRTNGHGHGHRHGHGHKEKKERKRGNDEGKDGTTPASDATKINVTPQTVKAQ